MERAARQVVAALFLIAAAARAQSESAEAANAAAWLRALPPVSRDAAHFGVIGGVSMVHMGPQATDFIRASGPGAFYRNAAMVALARQELDRRITYAEKLAAGGLTWNRDVQNFPWGMIESEPGTMSFTLIDHIVDSGAGYVGTVMPYAGWELRAAGYPATADAMCTRLLTEDFFYLDFDHRMDRFKDAAAWQRYLRILAERYGDRVRYWQIHNEPEGDRCGLFRNDVAAFVTLMRDAYGIVHAACPSCQVLQGGAGIPLWRENEVGGGTFWRDFAAMGGAQYVDVIAVHYNDGKVDGGSIANFEAQVARLRELLGRNKPVWATEFGVMVDFGGQFHALPEKDAAAWYVRFYTAGLAAGVSRFFSDAVSFVRFPDGTVLLPFYVNKLLEAKLGGFTAAAKVADGQYRFRVGGSDRWVLWNGVPAAITGTVIATDMYGNESAVNAAALAPAESNPLIVTVIPPRRRAAR